MDFMAELAELAMASRLRRLSDTYWQAVTAIYRESGLDFEVKGATVFILIGRQWPVSVMDIAERLGITHPGVIQVVNELVQRGLVTSEKSGKDSRKRLLSLSPDGEAMVPKLQPLWDAFVAVNREMLTNQTHNLLQSLQEMEDQLAEKPFVNRVRDHLNQSNHE